VTSYWKTAAKIGRFLQIVGFRINVDCKRVPHNGRSLVVIKRKSSMIFPVTRTIHIFERV
jgi:hypothetical protein